MKNVLLISGIYPLPNGNRGTKVCHYFACDWMEMGYNVRAINIDNIYPRFFYLFAKVAQKYIEAKTGAVVYKERDNKVTHYILDGVPVARIPVYKPIPHGAFLKKSIKNAVRTIIEINKDNGFVPDVILGHFTNPQLEILSMLKAAYPMAKTSLVSHGDDDLLKKAYGKRIPLLMKNIDMWGFRSKGILNKFEALFGKVDNPFICYSGIPDIFLQDLKPKSFNKPLHNFIFVGAMIKRKYPEKVLDALCKAYPSSDFTLTYIGEGQFENDIKTQVNNLQLQNQVRMLGRINRNQIIQEYDKSDCMVMISSGEAYGLVYLEAMARGCITIASRNEGIDGVIIDGKNGFLCEAGNADELSRIIERINAMTPEKRADVSKKAMETAAALTDHKAAQLYIEDVIKRMDL